MSDAQHPNRRRWKLRAVLWSPPLILSLALTASLAGAHRGNSPGGAPASANVAVSGAEQVPVTRADGRQDELVAILVSATFCPAARRADFHDALPDLKELLAVRAEARELQLRWVGVSLDWDAMEGAGYLASLSTFDEIIAGGNWVNEGSLKYIWHHFPGEPAVPQLVLMERRLSTAEGGDYVLESEQVRQRIIGVDEILRWIDTADSL